ncbi:MAG TPA: DUF4190 domain-containing protein [Kofleriaceae bacterium]|nr:DUF4190 domain-containing protein [Kofleriaceae bacterium]
MRTLKANMKMDGKPCGWCQAGLRLGEDAAVCTACEREHHLPCWESHAGCSTQGCANAPLRRLDAPGQAPSIGSPFPQGGPPYPPPAGSPFPQGGPPYPPPAGSPFPSGGGAPYAPAGSPFSQPPSVAPPGFMNCPTCRSVIVMGAQICPMCRAITSPDGLYHGPKTNAPGAVSSLVCGIIGLVFCQIILGPVAIIQANSAKRAMAADPTLGGEGLATAGMVMGIVDLVVFVLAVLVQLSK